MKGIQISVLVQKLWWFCLMGGFCLLVELHGEGSALQQDFFKKAWLVQNLERFKFGFLFRFARGRRYHWEDLLRTGLPSVVFIYLCYVLDIVPAFFIPMHYFLCLCLYSLPLLCQAPERPPVVPPCDYDCRWPHLVCQSH